MSDILKYINGEVEISKFKIKVLNKINKNYSKRLIKKEKRFIDFDFSVCNFSSIEEARDGLDLFRSSERDFYILYNIDQKKDILDYSAIINFLKEKKGDAICNKFSYLDYQNKKIINGDGSIKKVICDRNLFISDFLTYFSKNITILESGIHYDNIKSKIIFDMFNEKKILNIKNILSKDCVLIKKTDSTFLLGMDMRHKGNEKLHPVSCMLLIKNKPHFILKFNNFKKNGNYYKALKLYDKNIGDICDIDLENSYCLVFKTRRSMESFIQIEKNIKIIVKELCSKFNIQIVF